MQVNLGGRIMFKVRNFLNFKVIGLMFLFSIFLGISLLSSVNASEPVAEDFQAGFGDYQEDVSLEGDNTSYQNVFKMNLNTEDSSILSSEEPLDATTKFNRPLPLQSAEVTWADYGPRTNWRLLVEVTVIGMADHDKTTLAFQPTRIISREYESDHYHGLYKTIYLFDCGTISYPGIKRFSSQHTGITYPYNTKTAYQEFEFTSN